jgi:RHS repeat-associated protein
VANYEYGPFGELIRQTGPMAKANPIRFSTKYHDNESDLVYYGYRFYNQSEGTWLSRDPDGEMATRNLTLFVRNLPTMAIDPDGREVIEIWASAYIPESTFHFLYKWDPSATWHGDGRILPKVKGSRRAGHYLRIETDPAKALVLENRPVAGITRVDYFPGMTDFAPDVVPPAALITKSGCTIIISFGADTKDPLTPSSVTPSLHYYYTIIMNISTGDGFVIGNHKFYPSYDLIIKRTPLEWYNAFGLTPLMLFLPPMPIEPKHFTIATYCCS